MKTMRRKKSKEGTEGEGKAARVVKEEEKQEEEEIRKSGIKIICGQKEETVVAAEW